MSHKPLQSSFLLLMSAKAVLAHDIVVHENITLNAARSAVTYSPTYENFLLTVSGDCTTALATSLMRVGSAFEDNADQDVGGKRSLNHFYDPVASQSQYTGLSEIPTDFRIRVGLASFTWASTSNCPGYDVIVSALINPHTTNIWSWPNARGYQWLGLTSGNPSDRSANLGNMYRALGQVVHLLQDTTQPQHVRNEQHLDYVIGFRTGWHSHIEDYGAANWRNLNYSNSVLDWRSLGFTKLEEFWDRHVYNGDPQALDHDASGGTQLGLAEFCNGNFIGERHSYGDYFESSDIAWYRCPRRDTSTDYYTVVSHLPSGIDNFILRNGHQGSGIYLAKTSDGIAVAHHSRFTYWGAKFPKLLQGVDTTTILDTNVLHDYLAVLIPKSVAYSSGLLDYFFRGIVTVRLIGYDSSLLQFTNSIMNTSGQDFMGGTFSIYQDDDSGFRSLIAQTNLTGTLANSNSILMTFPDSASSTNKLLVVYEGTIGVTNGTTALDPVDANIGIAAQSFAPNLQTKTYNYHVSLSSLGLSPGASITNVLESDDFPFTPTSGNYQATVNVAYFDDNGSIGGVAAPVATDCNWPHPPLINGVVPISAVSIVGNNLSVPIIATDNGCGYEIGWVNVSITWLATPPP